jgi:hypothetical protein
VLPRNAKDKYVAQDYVADPLLLDGYKFDVRIYAMVESLKPLKVRARARRLRALRPHLLHPALPDPL